MTKTPAVSVIIPLYNAEKFLAECLDSVLEQTFQDFEVIVVNDCSTDGSRQIAESCLEKFGGRLTIYDNHKNLGVSASRNKGLNVSRGEYIFFLDADDLILPEGLENLYGLAKYFDADVVSCSAHFDLSDDGTEQILRRLQKPAATDENIFENNLEWRVKGLLADNFYRAPRRRLLRRDFLIRNGLFFPEKINIYEDRIWTIAILLCAEKFLHTPLAAYVCRKSPDSLSRQERTPLQNINIFINAVFRGIEWLDKIMDRVSFFETNPKYRFKILDHVAQRYFDMIYAAAQEISQAEIYYLIKSEFGKNFGEYDVLIPVLCTLINTYEKSIAKNKLRIAELEKE